MGWKKALAVLVVGGAVGIAIAEGPLGTEGSATKGAGPKVPRKPGEGDVAMLARSICRIAVPQAMNDPDSVEFLPDDTWTVTLGADHRHVVRLALRAKNAFNATVLGEFDCFVEDRGEELEALRVVAIEP
jgi:hypothetical protein